jgi:HK97 family phage prohead protease
LAAKAAHRVKLWHEHDGPLIGRAVNVEDRPDGVWVRSKFSNTPPGQEARELARDGTLDQCSVTFKPMDDWYKRTDKPDGIHFRHSRAYLLGVALVAHGAYGDEAYLAEVRDADPDKAVAMIERDRELRRQRLLALNH